MSEWSVRPMSQVVELVIDHRGKTPTKLKGDWAPSGVRVISAMNLANGRVDDDNVRFVSRGLFKRWMRDPLKPGDVLLTSEAPLGVAAYWSSPDDVVLGQRLFALRADPRVAYGRYLYYWMTSEGAQTQLHSRATGTTVLGIRQSELVRLKVPLPPLEEQRAIGDILGALDDKIESNRRTLSAADGLLRTEVASIQPTATDGPTVHHGTLGQLVHNVRVQVQPADAIGQPYIGLEHMPRGAMFVDDWGFSDSVQSQKWQYREGDILFGKLRPYFKKVGVPPVSGICSTDILVLRPHEPALLSLALATLASDEVVEYASAASTGTRMPRADWSHLREWRLAWPSDAVGLAAFHGLRPLIDLALHLVRESRTLAALRDALLPELLSGRLRVPEARERVEAVT